MRKTPSLSLSLSLMAAIATSSASADDLTEDMTISAIVNDECSMLVTQWALPITTRCISAPKATETARCW